MAYLKQPLNEEEIQGYTSLAKLKEQFKTINREYAKLINGEVLYCHNCNKFHSTNAFYQDERYKSGYYPECKEALMKEACDYDPKEKTFQDNKDKTKYVFKKLDLPFIDSLYNSSLETVTTGTGEKTRHLAYSHMMTMVKSLWQYKNLKWKDSVFDPDESEYLEADITKRTPRKEIVKLFGQGFTVDDYLYLQDQYDDWRKRTQVDSKSQETYVMQICLQLLDISRDRRNGKDVSAKLKALDTLMASANLQPKQNVDNSSTDALSFGQLIEKWENEEPIPEIDEEFKDVNGIGKLIRVFFSEHILKALGLKNSPSEEYEAEMKKYSADDDEGSVREENTASIYKEIFGGNE